MKTKTKKAMPTKAQMIASYQKQQNASHKLLACLRDSKGMDQVTLIVTKFRNVLTAGEGNRLTLHKVRVNGGEPVEPGTPEYIALLHEMSGTPKMVNLSIVDGEPHENGGPVGYCPVGVAFRPESDPTQKKSIKARNSFAAGNIYFYGKHLYTTFSPKFNIEHLKKYAVIIQRQDNSQVGAIDPSVPNDFAR